MNEHKAHRVMAAYFHQPLFGENFSAREAIDPTTKQSLKDWKTAYQGANRAAEYLKHVGRDCLFVTVAGDGSALYPSDLLAPNPRFDPGLFSSVGLDPIRKDILELLLRVFDREGLAFVPTVRFSSPLPALEQLKQHPTTGRQIQLIGSDGRTFTERYPNKLGKAPHYNPLHPEVQKAMMEVVRELMQRYAHHPSLAGLGVELAVDNYTQLPGVAWGLDDRTIADFEKATGTKFKATGPQRYQKRAKTLEQNQKIRTKWLQWRSQKLAEFHHRIQEEVRRFRFDAKLFLLSANIFRGEESELLLHKTLIQGDSLHKVFQSVGIDPQLYRGRKSPVLMRPNLVQQGGCLAQSNIGAQELQESQEFGELFDKMPTPSVHCFLRPDETTLTSDTPQATVDNPLRVFTLAVPSSDWNRQRFVHALAANDTQMFCDGGWMLPMGQDQALEDFVYAFRSLPAVRFEAFRHQAQPLTLRYHQTDHATYLYLVNDSPWPITAQLSFELNTDAEWLTLSRATKPPIRLDKRTRKWEFQLQPFDMQAARISDPRLVVSGLTVDPQETIKQRLKQQIDQVSAKMAQLTPLMKNRPHDSPHVAWNLRKRIENEGFETNSPNPQEIPGWIVHAPVGTEIKQSETESRTGKQSVQIRSIGPAATLASTYLDASETGVLMMLVWMRIENPEKQPHLQLVMEAVHNNETFYRFAPVGAGSKSVKLTKQWRSYLFRVDDLPPTGSLKVRVGFELMGPGEVLIDDVSVSPVVLNPIELTKLRNTIATAHFALKAKRYGDVRRLLNGFWVQMLGKKLPTLKIPVDTSASNDTVAPSEDEQAATKAQETPKPEPKTSEYRWWDIRTWMR